MSGLRIRPLVDDVKQGASLPKLPVICGELLHEGDVCFIFGSPNCGKTPLGLAMCEQFSGGQQLPYELRCEAKNGVSLFLDCELSERQQGNRYRGSDGNPFEFHKNVLRATFDSLPSGENATDAILDMLNKAIDESNVDLVVIDNITALHSQTEKSFDSARLVLGLKQIAKKGVTVVVIAHTPKRPEHKPITSDCMAGSKVLSNLADSIVSVMPSAKGQNIKRIQQHKSRNSESCTVKYGSGNNLIVESEKLENGMITFNVVDTSPERDHLPQIEDNDSMKQAILQAKRDNPLKSNRTIATEFGVNHMKVNRILKADDGTSGTSGTTVPSVPTVPVTEDLGERFDMFGNTVATNRTNGHYGDGI